jgi:hypothetical protein
MITRRTLISSTLAAASLCRFSRFARANDLPQSLANAKDQYYNFVQTFAEGRGLNPAQKVVYNSLIRPLDLALDTPYYNQELFREYSDATFKGGNEGLHGATPASSAERFSSQYRSLINLAAAQIDQNHPEIQNSLADLQKQLDKATEDLTAKFTQLDTQWQQLAAARHLTPGTNDYELQRITWEAQVRYGDQIAQKSTIIDGINSRIDAVRRGVYSTSEAAVLDNISVLSSAYNVALPWTAQTERSFGSSGSPLNDLMLGDVNKIPPARFDISPLIAPVGDLKAFLSQDGNMGFDTGSQSSQLSGGTRSWAASGGGSFLGWSLGGGGSGSSSFSRSMSQLNRITLSFKNMAEYPVDRSAWYNPAVLQDPAIYAKIKNRREVQNLQYVAVGLILVRGTNLTLTFVQQANSSDFSKASWEAHGGGSFLGFSFGGGGSNARSDYTISHDANWTNVTFADAGTTSRVVGVRVEPFLTAPPSPETLSQVVNADPSFRQILDDFESGKTTYSEFQKAKISAMQKIKSAIP